MTNRYQIKAKGPARAELLIYGDIGDSWWEEESNDAKSVVSNLADMQGREIDVRINSFGGSVSDGLAIYNALRRHKSDVATHVDGVAFSIASLIAMGGKTVNMASNSLMMLHAPWTCTEGNAEELRSTADTLDKYADAMASAYEREGGPWRDEIDAWLKDGKDHYFTAEEAANAGLIDAITASVDIAAALRGGERFNPPAAQAAHKPEATVADEKDEGGNEPTTSETFLATHARAVQAGASQGAKAEHARQKDVRAEFCDSTGAFAFGDESDASDPMAALMSECLDDLSCDAAGAARRISAAFRDGYKPVQSVEQQASPFGVQSFVPQPVQGMFSQMPGQAGPKRISINADQRDKFRDGMVLATLGRMGVEKQDSANPWRGHSLLALARDCLVAAGQNPFGMSDKDIAFRVLNLQTTSDFPVILENTMHKLVMSGFESAPGAWRRFCKAGSVSDLREWKRITPGLLSDLEGQDEHGAYRGKPIPDGEAEGISAELVGNIIGVTANVLINDDLNYIESRARGVGMAGERTIERKVWALLAANPLMSDGNALFSAAHENLANGTNAPVGDPTIDSVDQMAAAMAEQKAPAAKDDPSPTDQYLDLLPYAAVAHRWRRSVLSVINSSTTDIVQAPGTAAGGGLPFEGLFPNANPMAGTFQQIATSVMAERVPWYMFADPMVAPIIEVVFLNGQQSPQVTMETDFNTSGLKWKVELPHGVGAIGWRGAMKNPGA